MSVKVFDAYGNSSGEFIQFPNGERLFRLDGKLEPSFIQFNFENQSDIMDLMLAANSLKGHKINLMMPYVPYSRQDRVTQEGESFSLKVFCDLINSLNFNQVHITDPHSNVTPALLNNCVIETQYQVFFEDIHNWPNKFYLISPDAGAAKKIHELIGVSSNCLGVIQCDKIRDTVTGKIKGMRLLDWGHPYVPHSDYIIIDDICDGGATFTKIADELDKVQLGGRYILMVTHGFFTKGLEPLHMFKEIHTSKGQIK